MPGRRLIVAALFVSALMCATATAQKNELSGLIGRTFVSNQGIQGATFLNPTVHFGNGLTFEVNYGRRILRGGFASLTLEVPTVVNLDEDLNAGTNELPESYKSFFVAPSARLNIFSETAVSPWVSFGGGWGYFKESDKAVFFGPNLGKTGTSTGVYQVGVGLDVKVVSWLTVRGEARDFNSGVPQLNVDTGKTRQHNYFVGGGVVWHF